MAIGARILSDNLSGKTATVTFTPVTGTTSGDTQNLGEKTIPFNNISSHPYGYYNINVTEYDYTYTLFIEQPINDKELFVLVSQIIESNNYGVVTMNSTDFTADIIDFGVDATYWDINNIYPLQESGFLYEFEGRDNYQEKYILFTDYNNQVIGTYTGTTDNRDLDALDGNWVTFEDAENGILKASNGNTVLTFEWDPNVNYIDIQWDWDSVNKDKSFVFEKGTIEGYDSTFYLGKQDGTLTDFYTLSESGYTADFKLQFDSTFMVGVIYDSINSRYQEFDIRDENGAIIGDSYVLSGASYNDYNYHFYGDNKIVLIFWDNNDNTVDYKIYHFDGNTNTMVIETHNREFYPEFVINANSRFYPDDNISNNVVIVFHQIVNWVNFGYEVSKCDIVYMLSGQTGFTTYNFVTDTNKVISPWGNLTNNGWFTSASDEAGYCDILCINSNDGVVLSNTEISGSTVGSWNYDIVGNNFISIITNNFGSDINFIYNDSSGVILDSLFYTGASYNWWTTTDILYLTINNTDAFYLNNSTTGFTPTTYYNSIRYVRTYFTDTFLDPDTLFLYDNNTRYGRFLKGNSLSSEFLLPGSDNVDTDNIVINLYDFNGNLLNTHETEFTSWNGVQALKNRFIVKFPTQGLINVIMINEDTILMRQITDLDNYDSMNDYVWWND
jgi:hypothetical protein